MGVWKVMICRPKTVKLYRTHSLMLAELDLDQVMEVIKMHVLKISIGSNHIYFSS